MDYYEPCRLCGASTDLLVPIASGEGLELCLETKILSHLPIEFSASDAYPQGACYPCVESLLTWDAFVSRCVAADAQHRAVQPRKEETIEEKTAMDEEDTLAAEEPVVFSDSDYEPLTMKLTKSVQKKRFVCDKCGKEFGRKRSLTAHSRSCRAASCYECNLCGNVYKTEVNLKRHRDREHDTNQEKCTICTKVISSQRMESHMKSMHAVKKTDHEKDKFKCKMCDEHFKSKFLRSDHMKEVHYRETIKCDQCDFEGTRVVVKRHLRNVHAEKRYPCKLCSYSFKTHHLLKTHMASHSDLRSFICDICGMGFKRLNNVRDHMKCHQEKSNQCQICGKFFARKRYLAVHQKTIHNFYADGSVPEEKGFECGVCGAKLKWKQNLMAHMRIHTGEKPYECKICQKSFICHGSLRSHMNKHDLAMNSSAVVEVEQKPVFPILSQFNTM